MSMGPTGASTGPVYEGGDPGAPTPTGTTSGSTSTTTGQQAGDTPSTAEQAKQAASGVAHEAKEGVRTVVQEAGAAASDVTSKARQQLRERAGEQTDRAAEGLHQFAGQLRQMADGADGQGLAPDFAREASQRVQQFADRLQSGGLDSIADDAKRFARARPMTFLLGAAAAGVLVGRLLRVADTSSLAQAARDTSGEGNGSIGQGATGGLPPVDLRTPTPGAIGTTAPGSSPSGISEPYTEPGYSELGGTGGPTR